MIPNTAIAIGESMTVIADDGADSGQLAVVTDIFNRLGETLVVEERLLDAAMALGSCGTAYALRYVRAAMEAGVGRFYPGQAKKIVAQTVKGACQPVACPRHTSGGGDRQGDHPGRLHNKRLEPHGGLWIQQRRDRRLESIDKIVLVRHFEFAKFATILVLLRIRNTRMLKYEEMKKRFLV